MLHTKSATNYLRQIAKTYAVLVDFRQYAIRIGCRVVHDEIQATPKQAELLASKWTELTR